MLELLTDNIWTTTRPLRFFGLEIGTRMTVVRLAGGGLFVHSPVALDAPTREAVDALGPVVAIVAPCLFHHLFVADWARAYPGASVSGCPGLADKRRDVRWSRVLGAEPAADAEWRGEIDQALFDALPVQNEVVFFHLGSRTLISSDLVFHLSRHPSAVTRAANRLLGTQAPGVTVLERWMLRDRAAGRGQIDRMIGWGPERLVLAHGPIVERGGSVILADAYRWLDGRAATGG